MKLRDELIAVKTKLNTALEVVEKIRLEEKGINEVFNKEVNKLISETSLAPELKYFQCFRLRKPHQNIHHYNLRGYIVENQEDTSLLNPTIRSLVDAGLITDTYGWLTECGDIEPLDQETLDELMLEDFNPVTGNYACREEIERSLVPIYHVSEKYYDLTQSITQPKGE